MAEHELKTWTTVYPDIAEGLKSFDIRPNDRDFHVDDVLVLREYDPILGTYTGRSCVRRVTYVLAGGFGLRDGYVAMGIAQWKPNYLTLDQIDSGGEFNGVKVGQLGESDDVFAFTHDQEKAINATHELFQSTGDQIHKISVIEVKWWRVVDNCGCGDTCPHKPDEDGETEHNSCMHWGLPPCTEVFTWVGLTCEAGDVGALPVIVMEVELR